MSVLIAIALKSLLVAGLTLGLLALMRHRSAAERSWVAHIGLLALMIMAFAPLALPSWNVEAPALFAQGPATEAPAASPLPVAQFTRLRSGAPATPVPLTPPASRPRLSAALVASAVYAVPAAVLLLITLLALARLIALRARADVLVDGHWLTALARAQKRMGFKHGTALLTSNALASPISWGLVRPVILLNSRAVEASNEAEAILAHELAHVARMDWVKLLLARLTTALFWFNPLVWVLAREAHQLREETADDAVLAADIADTDYAQLLVGVARHECSGLLLGAHGVAPSKSSLARRVARVLDGKSVRGPVARGFTVGVFVGAVLVAAPLAALTLTPGGPTLAKPLAARAGESPRYYGRTVPVAEVPADLPHIIASGVSTSVATAAAAMAPVRTVVSDPAPISMVAANGNRIVSKSNGETIFRSTEGTITVSPPDSSGRRRAVLSSPEGTLVSYLAPGEMPPMPPVPPVPPPPSARQKSAIDHAIQMRAVGATPEYVASMRSVLPQLRLTADDIVSLKAVGVTPEFIHELARQGYRDVTADDISGAYAVGVRSDYIRGMAAVGYPRISLRQLTEMRAVGVMPSDVERFRRAGFTHLDVDELVQAKTLGLTPEEIRASRDDP
ncbi:MAG TPA: M56 family metallopeptidase [Sphingomicrobium sp.]|nr:M56 family metallopeptidase [Sphingomicrobium sp.]